MSAMLVLFLTAAFSTFFCTAVNAYTWRIAYPLWRHAGPDHFAALHREYLRLLGPIITFPHIVMFFASAALLGLRPAFFSLLEAVALFTLNANVVGLSAFVAGPIHTRFTRTGVADEPGLSRLILISAIRTVMMLASSGILLVSQARALSRP